MFGIKFPCRDHKLKVVVKRIMLAIIKAKTYIT